MPAGSVDERVLRSRSLWLDQLEGRVDPRPAMTGDLDVDVAIVGAGYTGLWTAYALLRADNLLYQVKVGDYMGQNYGRVLRISDSDLVLREVVQDAAGEWIERNSTLQLLERGAR